MTAIVSLSELRWQKDILDILNLRSTTGPRYVELKTLFKNNLLSINAAVYYSLYVLAKNSVEQRDYIYFTVASFKLQTGDYG